MAEEENVKILFATSRPSRCEELAGTIESFEAHRILEQTWAKNIGIDEEKVRILSSTTETSKPGTSVPDFTTDDPNYPTTPGDIVEITF